MLDQSRSLGRCGPRCFGPMIRGELYPTGFKGLRDIKPYDPSQDPQIWIDMYGMAMGVANATELMAAKYFPMVSGDATI